MKPSFFDTLSASTLRSSGPLVDVELRADCYDGSSCPPIRGKGMIDTGASSSAVDLWGLERARPAGTLKAQGPTSGTLELPVYSMRIGFPGSNLPEAEIERVAATPHLRDQGLVALIGRDVLERGRLTYDGPSGEFSLRTDAEALVVKSPAAAWGTLAAVGGLMAIAAWAIFREPKCPPCRIEETK